MFTGIIREMGTLFSKRESTFTFTTSTVAKTLKIGDSVSVNGCCLTCIELHGNNFSAEIVPETFSKTNFGTLCLNELVNLERPMKMEDLLDGHLVQGHVDGIGFITSSNLNSCLMEIQVPHSLLKMMVAKGSIAVDGVSLTIASIQKNSFSIALIPHTAKNTTLGFKEVGHSVNIEIDLIAKYIEKSCHLYQKQ